MLHILYRLFLCLRCALDKARSAEHALLAQPRANDLQSQRKITESQTCRHTYGRDARKARRESHDVVRVLRERRQRFCERKRGRRGGWRKNNVSMIAEGLGVVIRDEAPDLLRLSVVALVRPVRIVNLTSVT